MTRYFLISFFLFLLASCRPSGPEWDALNRAEAILNDQPDVAFEMLDSLDDKSRNPEFSARLKLAKADCEYYSDILTAKNDSAISEAIDYFRTHGDRERLTRAYFVRANQHYGAGEYSRAIIDYLNGEEWAIKTNDSVSLGLIYRGLFECYDQLDDMSSAVSYMEKSNKIFQALQSDRYVNWILYDYARSLNNALRYDEAIPVILECYEHTDRERDNYLNNECILFLGEIYNFIDDHNRAVEYFGKYKLSEKNKDGKRRYWMNYGRSLVELGRVDEAKAMQDSLTRYFPDEHYLKLRLAYKKGDTKALVPLLEKALNEQNEDFKTLYGREFANIVDSYYKEQQAAAAAREQRNRVVLAAVVILALVLGVALWIDVRRRRAERRNGQAALKLLEENLRTRESEHHALEESSAQQIEDMRRQLRELLKERFAAAERMTRDLADAPASKREQKIYARLRESLREFAPGSDYLHSVEATLNQMLGGLIADFRRDYPEAKEADVAVLVYQVLGVPTEVCAAVMDVTPATVYSKRSRLRTRIQAHPARADRYLRFLA
ncbi:MAG: hypothetical protein HDS78_00735 [Bacteroidales bacterium]|nr:hypothetical protein [Bacteroidales bacterium]